VTLARVSRPLSAVVLAAVLGAAAGCGSSSTPAAGGPPPPAAGPGAPGGAKNVIFVNGDGMSAAHREAGRLDQVGLDGQLGMDPLPVGGSLTTDSRDPKSLVTDSAAAATTWATGHKTYNGAISVGLDKAPLPILGQQAKEAGKATGLVTTAQVTDASPAAFFSQTADRKSQDDIARQYLESSKPDVILGGGEDWWRPAGAPGAFPDTPAEDPEEASKGTKGDLVARAQQLGYTYASSPDQLAAANGDKLLGLFANEEMFQQKPEGQGDVYAPVVDLPTMTRKALDTLGKQDKGFFLFVEEEAIDEFAHANNGPKVLQGMRQLEATVDLLRDYVAQHPDTLLVVTGDHDCGGLSVDSPADDRGPGFPAPDGPFPVAGSDQRFVMTWTTEEHTDAPVPVTAVGPGSEAFNGRHANTFVHEVLAKALGIPGA
jgi:alkaline phosphatase